MSVGGGGGGCSREARGITAGSRMGSPGGGSSFGPLGPLSGVLLPDVLRSGQTSRDALQSPPKKVLRCPSLQIPRETVPDSGLGMLESDEIVFAPGRVLIEVVDLQSVFPNHEWQAELVPGLKL